MPVCWRRAHQQYLYLIDDGRSQFHCFEPLWRNLLSLLRQVHLYYTVMFSNLCMCRRGVPLRSISVWLKALILSSRGNSYVPWLLKEACARSKNRCGEIWLQLEASLYPCRCLLGLGGAWCGELAFGLCQWCWCPGTCDKDSYGGWYCWWWCEVKRSKAWTISHGSEILKTCAWVKRLCSDSYTGSEWHDRHFRRQLI